MNVERFVAHERLTLRWAGLTLDARLEDDLRRERGASREGTVFPDGSPGPSNTTLPVPTPKTALHLTEGVKPFILAEIGGELPPGLA